MTCPHDASARETACADGMCPLCLALERNAAQARIELFAAQYREWAQNDDAGYDALIALCEHHALAAEAQP